MHLTGQGTSLDIAVRIYKSITACSYQPVEKLSRERPLSNIFNFYVLLSVLLQFALHIGTMVYITDLAHALEEWVALCDVGSCIGSRVRFQTGSY